MTNKLTSQNQLLFDFFSKEINNISKLKTNVKKDKRNNINIYKSILYFSIIDALARMRFLNSKTININSKRFTSIIKKHGGFKELNLISIPILFERLVLNNSNKKLFDDLDEKISQQPKNATVLIKDVDSNISKILAPGLFKKDVKLIQDTSHINLIYKYRNFLVHEFKQPGLGMDNWEPDATVPFYHGYMNRKGLALVYPILFIKKLTENILINTVEYFSTKKIKPYDLISVTNAWYSEIR